MAEVRVGLRQLYDALGCTLQGWTKTHFEFSLDDTIDAEVYVGPEPCFPLRNIRNNQFVTTGPGGLRGRLEYHPGDLFTELICWANVEVSFADAELFHRDRGGRIDVLARQTPEDIAHLRIAIDV